MYEEYEALDQSYAFTQEMIILRNISRTSASALPTSLKCLISRKEKKRIICTYASLAVILFSYLKMKNWSDLGVMQQKKLAFKHIDTPLVSQDNSMNAHSRM